MRAVYQFFNALKLASLVLFQFGDIFLGLMMLLMELILRWVNVSRRTDSDCFYFYGINYLCFVFPSYIYE